MSGHALVVGGTGMLRGVCLDLAAKGWKVSALARRHAGLASLRQEAAARTGRQDALNPVPVDYGDIGALALGIRSALLSHGPITLAVCSIHATAPVAPIVIADTIATSSHPCTYIHVVGSQAPDELRVDGNRDEISAHPGIVYRRVILGFVRGDGRSRWLTNEEICRGVLDAVDDARSEQVVGVVSPWDQRPT